MKLIIAEKPSLARNIAAAISDSMQKKQGYFTCDDYIVTWGFGHLFALCSVESYHPAPDGAKGWTIENLPCFPRKYKFELRTGDNGKPDAGISRQFEIIQSLCRRPDVDTIINAGDSDREGEIIVRIIIDHALTVEEKQPKQLKRLWMPDQTAETIRAALVSPPDEKEYDLLAYEGYARTFIDWLYGVNLTRYATLKCGTLLRVGRVIVPIVKAIYDRDMAIKNFKPKIYYAIVSKACTNGEKVELTSEKKFDSVQKADAEALCKTYNEAGAHVSSVKNKKDTLKPGKLYSLSKLQNVLGKTYKMSMTESLAIVQKLYEEGYVTYPRTNSEYLATAEKDKVRGILAKLANIGYPVEFRDQKSIFDDSKIESHSALTPTAKIPDKSKLNDNEAKVYGTILRRFVAVFCAEPCIIRRSELTIDVGNALTGILESFSLKGNVILEPGWTKYDTYNGQDKLLPNLKKGDRVEIDFKPVEKETSPPKHYTIETLNNYLKNPFREELADANKAADTNKAADANKMNRTSDNECEENDDAEYRAMFEGLELGTEATRTGIIDNARKSGYIQLKKDVYTILPDGCYLIEALSRLGIGMNKYKTAEVGRSLKRVFRGEISINRSLAIAQAEIAAIFEHETPNTSDGFYGDVIGQCPLCGENVTRGRYGYQCSGYKKGCKLKIGSPICGRIITKEEASLLLRTGKTELLHGFISSKTGRTFDAYLRLDGDQTKFAF